jgi:hypothetical protein
MYIINVIADDESKIESERTLMSQRHPFSMVSCFRRFVSRDQISHYFDRLICQRAVFIEFYYALFLFV